MTLIPTALTLPRSARLAPDGNQAPSKLLPLERQWITSSLMSPSPTSRQTQPRDRSSTRTATASASTSQTCRRRATAPATPSRRLRSCGWRWADGLSSTSLPRAPPRTASRWADDLSSISLLRAPPPPASRISSPGVWLHPHRRQRQLPLPRHRQRRRLHQHQNHFSDLRRRGLRRRSLRRCLRRRQDPQGASTPAALLGSRSISMRRLARQRTANRLSSVVMRRPHLHRRQR